MKITEYKEDTCCKNKEVEEEEEQHQHNKQIIENDINLTKLSIETQSNNTIIKAVGRGDQTDALKLLNDDNSLVFASSSDQYGTTILHLASQMKMYRLVKVLLNIIYDNDQLEFDIDQKDINGNTALHYACSSSINELLNNSSSSNNSNSNNIPISPIVKVNTEYLNDSKSTRAHIVTLLLERGATPDLLNNNNMSPMHLASKEIDFDTVQLLSSYNAKPTPHYKKIDISSYSLKLQSLLPLTKYEESRLEEKKQSIHSKIDPATKGIKGPSCLHYSLSNLKLIKSISLDICNTATTAVQGKDIDIKFEKQHPLLKLIKLFGDLLWNANEIDETTGRNAFSQFIHTWPCTEEQVSELVESKEQEVMFSKLVFGIVRMLCQSDRFDLSRCNELSVFKTDNDMAETPLGLCALYPAKILVLQQILNYLLTCTPVNVQHQVIESVNSKGQTALFLACSIGNHQAVNELLEAGANPNALDSFGQSVFHETLEFSHYDIAKKLVMCGADVNKPMSVYPQSTPLHIVAQQGDLDMFDFLIKHGALLDSLDGEKQTVLQVTQNPDITDYINAHVQVTLIQRCQVVLPKYDFSNQLLIHLATQYGSSTQLAQQQLKNSVITKHDQSPTCCCSQASITINNAKNHSIRFKLRCRGEPFFKYMTLYHKTFVHLVGIIQNRYKSSIALNSTPLVTQSTSNINTNNTLYHDSIQQFNNQYIKSIVLLPNVLITQDDDLYYLKDDDEIEVDFKVHLFK
ncbi:hypothetical protein CYY_000106 [Polysphondylium violaceum]|uniref:Ankyrin repeat-containing protein n=1 Tax=Polysphondylium violaceum TaxID=133409 RepID=A0A8J4Q2H1_9MYCE|nr:hypothetical protein CYY_000106 [Polysphondylium violaceum]